MGGEGVATLGAVAELVINLSIAQRSHLIYGREHEIARRTADNAAAALERALALLSPIVVRFTPQAVFLGGQSLGAHHPIYRNFAERVWRLGIAGITFEAGAGRDAVVGLVLAINEATRRHATREQAEELLHEARLERIDVHFLRQLLTHEVRDEVRSLPVDEARRQWEELMAQLALLSGPLPREERESDDDERPRERADYAGAVIDYLKHVQHAQQQEATLQGTDFGQRVSDLITNLNPELRRQIAGAALAAPDVSAESLQGFVDLVGQDAMLETVRRLNRSGQSIPASAFRALSMLAMTQRDNPWQPASVAGTVIVEPVSRAPSARSGEELQRLLDGLMHEEPAEAYTTEEYSQLLRDAEQQAQRMVLVRKGRPLEVPMAPEEGEHHFALVAGELLRANVADRQLASTVCREAQRSCVRLLEMASPRGWLDAMKLARAAALEAEVEPGSWAWEQEEVLELLRERLTGAGRWQAEASVEQLVAVGERAAPLMVEVLATSDSLSVRRRALAGLVGLVDTPTDVLLPLLDMQQPWYLQRNAVYVLRERSDPAGAAAAKELWRRADPRVRTEIVGYLLTITDPDRLRYLDEALNQTDTTQALQVVRAVLKQPTRETIMAVVRRAERIPADLVGNPFHMGLLSLLAGTRQPQALHYVAELPARRQPVLPWQRGRFRAEVEAMVRGGTES